jgi:hypothetical protein
MQLYRLKHAEKNSATLHAAIKFYDKIHPGNH